MKEKIQAIGAILFIAFIICLFIHVEKVTSGDDLRNYKGYKITNLIISRDDSNVTIVGPNNDTIEKLFDNEEIEEVIKGLIIK